MPYSSNAELPEAVKIVLPEKAQDIWRAVFNDAFGEHGDKSFAIAWAALRNQGWGKTADGKWAHSSGVAKTYEVEIKKSDDEKRIAFGWAVVSRDAQGNEVWDRQNDAIDPEDLEQLAYKYVRFYRELGELHLTGGTGVIVESVVTTLEKQQIWGIPSGCVPIGWWVGFYVSDDDAWEKVKAGIYRAFSIEGTAERVEV
jgi:cation transport regulator ChaB